jgi:hypothetical protein
MKSPSALFLLAGLILGFTIAWIVKPDPKSSIHEQASAADTSNNSGNSVRLSNLPTSPRLPRADHSKTTNRDDSETTYATRDQAIANEKAGFHKRLIQTSDIRIQKLVAELGLDASQEAELRRFFDQRTEKVSLMWSEDGEVLAKDMIEALKPSHLDELMTKILSAEQRKSYRQLIDGEIGQGADSLTLAKLAAIPSSLELQPEQREAIYKIYYEESGKWYRGSYEAGNLTFSEHHRPTQSATMMALMQSTYDTSGVFKGISDAEKQEMQSWDQYRISEEAYRRKNEQQVERLEGILNEQQLKQYRESLNIQTEALLESMR